jgi:hypothetical protein
MLWPAGLAVFYPYSFSAPFARAFGAAVVLAALSWLAVAGARRRPWLLVGWLWYLVTLLPVIGIVQVGSQSMADRYTYVPLIGPFVAVSWWLTAEVALRHPRFWVPATAAVTVLLALAGLSWRQAGFWRNNETLYNHALRVTKDNWVVESNLGSALASSGRIADSVPHLREVIRIRPEWSYGYHNLAVSLGSLGMADEAMDLYREAIRLRPDYPEAHNNLGNALARAGRGDEALSHFYAAIRGRPDYAEAHYNLAYTLAGRGRVQEAAFHYREALRYRPDFTPARLGLERLRGAAPGL